MTQTEDTPPDGNLLGIQEEYIQAAVQPVSIRTDSRRRDPLVISVVRDEIALAEEFLRHYRRAGIRRFAIIDNNSADGTFEYYCNQHDVDLYSVKTPFSTVKKQAWLTLLIDLYQGEGQWFIHADADEHVVFDGIEVGLTFADLADVMDRQGISRVRGCLVDMYARDTADGAENGRGNGLREAYPCFDREGYREYRLPQLIAREGGPRLRLFGGHSDRFRPQLTKYPMFRLYPGDVFVNPHFLWPYDKNFRSECFLGILHFKFLPDFERKVIKAVAEGNYWEDSLEYRCYQKELSKTGRLSITSQSAEVYDGPGSLLRSHLISPVPW